MLLNPPRPSHKLRIESARVGLAWGLPLAAVVHASLALRSCRRAQLSSAPPTDAPRGLLLRRPRRRSVRPSPRRRFCRLRRAVAGAASVLSCVAARRASCGACAGHGCCCAACSVQITSCPLCRVQVRGSLRINRVWGARARARANYGCWAVCLRVRDAGRLWPAAAVCPSPAPACWLVQLARVAEVACRA